MTRLTAALLLLGTIATPAAARDGAWYVGGDFGGMIVDDGPIDAGVANNRALRLDYDLGFDAAAFVGYDLGAFRLEAEISYRRASLDSIDSSVALPNTSGVAHPAGPRDASGSTSALSFMINGMLDFGDEDGLSGFVGGGAGVARVDYNRLRPSANNGVFLDDNGDTEFAWQIVAGVRQSIGRNVNVHARYRFFNVGEGSVRGPTGFPFDASYQSHSLLVGISFDLIGSGPR